MRVLFETVDTAHVHFFRQIARQLQHRGHDILFTARQKDITIQLLEMFDLPYRCISRRGEGLSGMAAELLARQVNLFKVVSQWKPDVIVAKNAGPAAGPVSFLKRVPFVVLEDTEHAKLQRAIGLPFATVIVTGDGYLKSHGKRQRQYRGVWPQAYLDPKYFTPQKEPLRRAGVDPDQPYMVLRTVAWEAAHDAGHRGVSRQVLEETVHRLQRYGRVLISAERPLPESLKAYANPVPVQDVHHLLAFATLYIGEGGSMAAEAAVLGTPGIFTSVLYCGYLMALEKDYDMVYNTQTLQEGTAIAEKLLAQPDLKQQWRQKQQTLLAQSDDLCEFMIDIIDELAGQKERRK